VALNVAVKGLSFFFLGEWTESVSRKSKRERKVKQHLQDQLAEKEVASDQAVAVTNSNNFPDGEPLKTPVSDEVGSSNKESPGRGSGSAASTNSNADFSDFVHIEMRADEDGQLKVETVDSLDEQKKKKNQKESIPTAARDRADSPNREGAAEATAKPKQQRKRRKHKAQACTEGVRDDFDDDWEVF
jgi:hypothetical protein